MRAVKLSEISAQRGREYNPGGAKTRVRRYHLSARIEIPLEHAKAFEEAIRRCCGIQLYQDFTDPPDDPVIRGDRVKRGEAYLGWDDPR